MVELQALPTWHKALDLANCLRSAGQAPWRNYRLLLLRRIVTKAQSGHEHRRP